MLFRHKSASCPLSYFPPSCGMKLGLPKFGGLNYYLYLRKQNKEIKPM